MFGHSANRYGSKPVKLAHSHCSYPQTAVTYDEATEQVLSAEIKPQMSLKWLVKPDHTSSANVARLHWRQQHPSVCMHGLLTGSGALPSTITSSISDLRRPGWVARKAVARKAVAQKAVATDEPQQGETRTIQEVTMQITMNSPTFPPYSQGVYSQHGQCKITPLFQLSENWCSHC